MQGDFSTVAEGLTMIRDIGALVGRRDAAVELATEIETGFASLAPSQRQRAADLIWRDPWMTVGGDTFISDVMAHAGLDNVYADATRYPTVTPENLDDFLGVRKYRYGLAEDESQIGVVTGLAYTSVGGDLLHIEALKLPGKGRMKTTGKLGDVMKESIEAASSYVRSIAPQIGVKPPRFDKWDIHVHVPDGATPKDGPSAGLAMVTAIVSVLTGIPVRADVAILWDFESFWAQDLEWRPSVDVRHATSPYANF